MSERRDLVPNGLVNVPDHLASTEGISTVTPIIYFTPNTINASLESKLEEASIDLLPARRQKRCDGDSPIRIHS